jgi:hypothetical protein
MSAVKDAIPRDPDPADLLQYFPLYRVVVCTSCEYAVQPSAISRHLKDIHHIYRSRRRPYMKYVSKLDLDQPEVVLQSEIRQFPVPLLPVQDGLRCESEGCFYLCRSDKRMKSHWYLVHGRPGVEHQDWRSVPLQTFFSGNLLRYFTAPSPRVVPTERHCHLARGWRRIVQKPQLVS